MLLNISLKNYRSFKEEAVFTMIAEGSKSKEQNIFLQPISKADDELRLLKTAVIYGANSSGKSNLLRGVHDIVHFVCKSELTVGQKIHAYDQFKFERENFNSPIEFYIEFVGVDQVKYKYELSFNGQRILKEELTYWPNSKPVNLFVREEKSQEPDAITYYGKLGPSLKNKVVEVFHNQSILSKFGSDIPDEVISKVFIYISRLEVVNACNSSKVLELKREMTEKMLNDPLLYSMMNELIRFADTGLNGLLITEVDANEFVLPDSLSESAKRKIIFQNRSNISGQHSGFNKGELVSKDVKLPFEDESNGIKTLFSVGGKILEKLNSGGILFVDELETSLHPYVSKLLVSLFQNERINKKNAQLIFSTHDTNLLDRILFRKDQVWFAEKDGVGATELYSLQDFTDVREDTPFDKWYLAGKFGGIPSIHSLENLFGDNEEE